MERSVNAGIRAHGLSCGYGERVVLTEIELDVGPGEIVALLGPNGSGKSTLLKTLCRAIPPLAGSVFVAGEDAAHLNYSQLARHVAYVPQDEAPPFDYTVREIALMGRIAHSGGIFETRGDHVAAESAMLAADCGQFAERTVRELSGGERQRVWIARALAQESPTLLLDEPTAHLDVAHQREVAVLLRHLASEGRAIVAAVHDLNFAAAVATRAVLLIEGRIGIDAPCRDVLESSTLDRAFDLPFERLVRGDGARSVLPRLD